MHECPHVRQRTIRRAAVFRPLELFSAKASAFRILHAASDRSLFVIFVAGLLLLPAMLVGATTFQDELSIPIDVPVLVVNYFPVGYSVSSTQVLKGAAATTYNGTATMETTGARLSIDWVPGSVTGAQRLAEFLTQSTIYHGYQAGAPKTPALTFHIVDTITVLQRRDDTAFVSFGTKNATLGYNYFTNVDGYGRGFQTNTNPDAYRDPLPYIFDRIQVCKYVAGDPSVFSDASKVAPVRMIFFQNSEQAKLNPVESTAAGPFGFLGNNPDVQPLFCAGGSPLAVSQQASAAATYHVIGYHATAATSLYPTENSPHDFGHHYEQVFSTLLGDYFFPSPSAPFAGDMFRTRSFNGSDQLPGSEIPAGGSKDFPTFGIRVESLNIPSSSGTFRITQLAGATLPTRTFSASLQGSTHPEVTLGSTFTVTKGQRVTLQGYDLTFFPYAMTSNAIYATIYRPGDQFGIVRRCGWTHAPPNGEGNYDYGGLFFKARTDCESWTPDESGTVLTNVNCLRWVTGTNPTCAQDPGAGYRGVALDAHQYVMQNVPGLNNSITIARGGRVLKMRNLWAFIGDYDNARRRAQDFFYDLGIPASFPALTGFTARPLAGNQIQLTWDAPAQAVGGFNLFRRELWTDGTWSQFHRPNNTLLSAASTSFTDGIDLPLIPSRIYEYELRAVAMGIQAETGPRAGATAGPDIVPPTLADLRPANGSVMQSLTAVTGTATDNQYGSGLQKVMVRINLGSWQLATGLSRWSYTPPALADGGYVIEAQATDNGNTPSPIVSTVIRIDTALPVISGVSATNLAPNQATITWMTNEPTNSLVEYGLTASLGSSTPLDSALVTTHSATLTGLSSGTLYYYRVKSKDAAGNITRSSTATFTTVPLVTSNVNTINITTTGATTAWITNAPADSQVEYGQTTSYGSSTALNSALVIGHSVALSGLIENTLYHYRVKSKDATGKLTTSSDASFVTLADAVPPSISSIGVSFLSSTSVAITWRTNEPAYSQVEYGLTASLGSGTMMDSTLVTTHSVTVTGLSSGTVYYYRVKSKDPSDNVATSSITAFTLSGGLVISNITAKDILGTGATITWTTDKNSDSQVEYGLTAALGNSTAVNPVFAVAHSVQLRGLSGLTQYYYRVKSKDFNGNVATSGIATFTTLEAVPPIITGVSATNITSTNATIIWTTNEPATSTVYYRKIGGINDSGLYFFSLETAHAVGLNGLSPNTGYFYSVESTDAAGNSTRSNDATFTTAR